MKISHFFIVFGYHIVFVFGNFDKDFTAIISAPEMYESGVFRTHVGSMGVANQPPDDGNARPLIIINL